MYPVGDKGDSLYILPEPVVAIKMISLGMNKKRKEKEIKENLSVQSLHGVSD